MDQKYMKTIRFLLSVINCWPYHVFGEKARVLPLRSVYWLALGWAGLFVSSIAYINANYMTTSFFEMVESYLTVLFSVFVLQRYTMPMFKSYDAVIKEFVLEIHLLHHRHKTEYSEHIYRYINKICSIFVTVFGAETIVAISLFCIMPIYINFKRGMYSWNRPQDQEFAHSINYIVPFINHRTNFAGYLIFAIINSMFSYDLRACACGFDLVLYITVFHIWGHLKILDNSLRTIPKPNEMRDWPSERFEDTVRYTEEENKQIADILKNIINHHRIIVAFISKVTDVFGPMLFLDLLFHQVSGCLLLLECSSMDSQALGRFAPQALTLFQLLIEVAFIMELLRSQSETLKDAVYSIPWEYMNTSNRKLVLFLLMNVQEPISIKAMGIVSVGYQTMYTILKASFSYFMFLRTLH